MKRTLWNTALAIVLATPLMAQTPWVHVEVEDAGEKAAQVNVNLPLSVVRVALDVAPDEIVSNGKIHLKHLGHDVDVEELRALWNELRATGDADLVTVESDDETVHVRRDGDFIRVEVEDRKGDEPEQVHIDVPVRVIDALFAGEGETLNLAGALAELATERGDIIRVEDGEKKVRIWIDEVN